MRLWAQFWCESTGYVKGTIPPVFREEAVEPVTACGSDGIAELKNYRGRVTGAHLAMAREICRQRRQAGHSFTGFSLDAGRDLLHTTTVRRYEAVEVVKCPS